MIFSIYNSSSHLLAPDYKPFATTEGEHIEMGGIVDPESGGALIYRKTTQVESVEPEIGSEFKSKKIKKVTSETSWVGGGARKSQEMKEPLIEKDEVKPWHDEEVDGNPLYSSNDYVSDFQNPLYANRLSTQEGAAIAASGGIDLSDYDPPD